MPGKVEVTLGGDHEVSNCHKFWLKVCVLVQMHILLFLVLNLVISESISTFLGMACEGLLLIEETSIKMPDLVEFLRMMNHVVDELVQTFLLPGLEPGSTDGFLEFICYSEGRLPEELLPQVKCPVLVAWGDKDPRDPIELGRACGNFDSVEDFIVLPDVGIFLRMRHHIL